MTNERLTIKTLTPLMQLVCYRAAYIRACYAGSSWDADKKTSINKNVSVCSVHKKKLPSGLNNQVKKNAQHRSILTEHVSIKEDIFYF